MWERNLFACNKRKNCVYFCNLEKKSVCLRGKICPLHTSNPTTSLFTCDEAKNFLWTWNFDKNLCLWQIHGFNWGDINHFPISNLKLKLTTVPYLLRNSPSCASSGRAFASPPWSPVPGSCSPFCQGGEREMVRKGWTRQWCVEARHHCKLCCKTRQWAGSLHSRRGRQGLGHT